MECISRGTNRSNWGSCRLHNDAAVLSDVQRFENSVWNKVECQAKAPEYRRSEAKITKKVKTGVITANCSGGAGH